MMSRLRDALGTLRDEGAIGFLNRTRLHLQWRVGTPRYWASRVLGKKRVTVGEDNIYMSIDSYRGDYRQIKFFEYNEKDELRDILDEVRKDDVFLDIGANLGIYSLFIEKYARKSIAIEPHPVNISHFAVNKTLNNADVDIYQCAFSNSSGYIGLNINTDDLRVDGTAETTEIEATQASEKIITRVETADEFITKNNISIPNVVKIDVQGAEAKIIEGFSDIFGKDECRLVYCEVHEDIVSSEKVEQKLENMGFTTHSLDRETDTVKAKK